MAHKDVSGDGLPDIIQGLKEFWRNRIISPLTSIPEPDGSRVRLGIRRSSSLTTDTIPVPASSPRMAMGSRTSFQGFSDASGSTTYGAYINKGAGWTQNNAWNPRAFFIATGTTDVGARLADVNGDGLPDVIEAYTDGNGTSHYTTYLNNGSPGNYLQKMVESRLVELARAALRTASFPSRIFEGDYFPPILSGCMRQWVVS